MTDGKTQVKDHHKTGANKELARRFVQRVLIEGNTEHVAEFFAGDNLIQHNPHMGDGVTAFLQTRRMWENDATPARHDRIHRVLGEGSFVLVLSEGEFNGKPTAFYDLYRIESGEVSWPT